MAIFRVEKNKNYTVMSNYHLKDKNLSLKSKGLLSVILSLPDEWNYTTRGLASICKEGVDCISASLRELETAGYLERNQLRDERGRITDTEYIIYEFPHDKSNTASPCTENPDMDESDTENTAQYNTNKPNNPKVNTDLLNTHQSITHGRIDEIESYNNYREIIHENIDYEILCERYDRKTLDEIVETMLDYVCGKRDFVKIGGAEYPHEIVKSRLLKIESSHIAYVCNCISQNVTKVRNIRAYMLTTLYNAPTTIDHYYSTLVSHDMSNMRG